jgi:NADPH:quinone reductase-like Zn-dependent oxidoreductase
MLAAYLARTGGDDPLANLEVGDLPTPEPRPGWALLKVEAAALNHHDLWLLRGVSASPIEPPQVLGTDAAGTVAAYGPDAPEGVPEVGSPVLLHAVISCGTCPACRRGEELYCRRMALFSDRPYDGTLAEYVAVPAVNLVPRPAELSAVDAACLPTAYLTAYRMLFTRAGLRPGSTVLVQGAGGGVATAALAICQATGITAIATSRDEAKRAAALEQGAVAALAPDRAAAKQVLTLTGGGVDAVIETVGEATWDLSLRALRPGGAVVVAGATSGGDPPAQLNRVFYRQLSVLGSTMGTRAELERLIALVRASGLRPRVDRTYPLAEARAALQRMAAGEQHGKIVLVP